MRARVGTSMAIAALAAGVPLLSAACDRSDRAIGTERGLDDAPPAQMAAIAFARDGIVAARCDREANCNHFGPDRRYANRNVCAERIRTEWRDELNFAECPGGVNFKELNECLEEIRNENCNDPFDTLGRIVACRSSDLCRALP